MSRSRTAESRATIGRYCSPVCYTGPALRRSGGSSHGLIDPPSTEFSVVAERIGASPGRRRPRADPRSRRGGTEDFPDRDVQCPAVEPQVDRPAPPGTHRPALAADLRAAKGPIVPEAGPGGW